MLEYLCNLDKLQQDVSFLTALPCLKVEGIDASSVQATVIEGIEATGNFTGVILARASKGVGNESKRKDSQSFISQRA